MEVKVLASGSRGNCIAVQTGGASILVDCGLARTKIEKILIQNNIYPHDIKVILITHAHGDHADGLILANKWRIPVFATEGEWKDIRNVDEELRNIIAIGNPITIGDATIEAFKTHHNTFDSCGYTIAEHDFLGEKASICVDTGKVDNDMIAAMLGSDHIIIESNYDHNMQVDSNRPEGVKARNLSDVGHLSNEQTAKALQCIVIGGGEHIYLMHISKECNTRELAKKAVNDALELKGFKQGQHYHLEVI